MVTFIFIMLPESDCANAAVAGNASAHRQQMRLKDDTGMGVLRLDSKGDNHWIGAHDRDGRFHCNPTTQPEPERRC